MKACEWTNLDEVLDCPGTPRKSCAAPATHTTCDPMGAVVCEAHRCRCSKRLPPEAPPPPEVLP